jgi:large subunit ribosomal protein L30|tara:strand:+ start:335 stop:538 length:204 start_codon:yes stop_codon:yes gene_type:complete
MDIIKVVLKKSSIGFPHRQRAVLESLGLHRLHQEVEHKNTPSIRGMITKVRHLVDFEYISNNNKDNN